MTIYSVSRVNCGGSHILDLGCAPGSWLQVACKELGSHKHGGIIVGVDIQAFSEFPVLMKACLQEFHLPDAYIDDRVHTVKADIRSVDPEVLIQFARQGFDLVLSDMLPSTSGNALLDVQRSLELTEAALDLSTGRIPLPNESPISPSIRAGVLKEGGHLIMKVFEGVGTNEFVKSTRQHFREVLRMRPEAVRKASREFYLVCKYRRPTKQ